LSRLRPHEFELRAAGNQDRRNVKANRDHVGASVDATALEIIETVGKWGSAGLSQSFAQGVEERMTALLATHEMNSDADALAAR
jgi:hypothetical protein